MVLVCMNRGLFREADSNLKPWWFLLLFIPFHSESPGKKDSPKKNVSKVAVILFDLKWALTGIVTSSFITHCFNVWILWNYNNLKEDFHLNIFFPVCSSWVGGICEGAKHRLSIVEACIKMRDFSHPKIDQHMLSLSFCFLFLLWWNSYFIILFILHHDISLICKMNVQIWEWLIPIFSSWSCMCAHLYTYSLDQQFSECIEVSQEKEMSLFTVQLCQSEAQMNEMEFIGKSWGCIHSLQSFSLPSAFWWGTMNSLMYFYLNISNAALITACTLTGVWTKSNACLATEEAPCPLLSSLSL